MDDELVALRLQVNDLKDLVFGVWHELSTIQEWIPDVMVMVEERRAEARRVHDQQVAQDLAQRFAEERQREAEERTYPCAICLDEATLTQLYILDECNHRFCRGCIAAHVKMIIQNGSANVTCPIPLSNNEHCPGNIDIHQIKEILSLEDDDETITILSRVEELKFEELMRGNPDYARCPNLIRDTDDGPQRPCNSWGVRDQGPNVNHARCLKCRHHFCVSCHLADHAGTCEEYSRFLAEHGNNSDEAAYYQYRQRLRVKSCPGCREDVERNGGCDHMTCRCGVHFCYRCGGGYDQRGSHACNAVAAANSESDDSDNEEDDY